MKNNGRPEWLKKAPDWFQAFFDNDFNHLKQKMEWSWKLQFLILGTVFGAAVAIVCKGI